MRFKTKGEAFRSFSRMMEHIYETLKERNVRNLDAVEKLTGSINPKDA